MNNYVPFLKLKSNEILAVKELESELQKRIIPFFDFPTKDELTEDDFIKKAKKMANSVKRHLKLIPNFYLDNFDVDSDLFIHGVYNYSYLMDSFHGLPFIPVISIDRCSEHIESVLNAKKTGSIDSNTIAIRLAAEDFENYATVEDELQDEVEAVFELFDNIDIIFDCRVCLNIDVNNTSRDIINFSKNFYRRYKFRKMIVTGSSIPPSIKDIATTESEVKIHRNELAIFNIVHAKIRGEYDTILGDYGIVSPNYSDVKIMPEAMLNITTAKIIYTYGDQHFVLRGGALKTHPRGFEQYNDLAESLVGKHFYRGAHYSFGDDFLEEKSHGIGNNVTPGTIIKPALNAHIAYMMKNYEAEPIC